MADSPEETEKIKKLKDEIKELESDLVGKTKEQSIAIEKQIGHLVKKINLLKETKENEKEALDLLEKEMAYLANKKRTAEEDLKYLQTRIKYNDILIKKYEQLGLYDSEKYENLKKENKEFEKQLEAQEKLVAKEKEKGTLLDRSLKTINLITGGYLEQIAKLTTIDGIWSKIGSSFTEILQTNESLVKATGQVGLMSRDTFKSVTDGMGQFAIGYKEMGEAFGGLYTEMSAFSALSDQQRDSLAQNAAKMNNLGVSVQTTGKNFDLLNKALRVDATEVGAITDKVTRYGMAIGVTPAKMAADLGAALPQLAANGKKAVDVFINLQKESKSLGIEMSSLLGIVGQGFDTFEGAADKAGKLNAILGGDYLNSVEMLNATEDERVEILKKSFEASGKNFESLDRFEQKAIAASLGLKDVTEAQKMFREESLEDKIIKDAQAKSQEELTKAQQASANTMRQLELIFADVLKFVEPLASAFKTLTTFLAENRVVAYILLPVLIGLKVALTSLSAGFFSFGKASSVAKEAGKNAGEGVGEFGSKASKAIPTVLAFGAAMLMIGGGIYFAATGIAQLVQAFASLTGEQVEGAKTAVMALMIGLVLLGAGLVAVAFAGSAAAVPLAIFGAAMLAVGYAIKIASEGMSIFVNSITKLVSTAGQELNNIATGVKNLSLALIQFAGINPIGDSGLSKMKEMISDISELINEIPNTVEFNAKVNNLKTIGNAISVAAASGEKLAPAKEFVIAAKEYHIAQRDSKTADNDALVQAIKKIVPGGSTGGTVSSQSGTPIILRIENGPDLRAYVLGDTLSKII